MRADPPRQTLRLVVPPTRADDDESTPDFAVASQFLSRLESVQGNLTFQAFDDRKKKGAKPRPAKILHGTLAQRWPELLRLNSGGYGIHVTINLCDGRGRKKENMRAVRAFALDLDGSPLDPVLKACEGRLPPHAVVESSPGRFHVWFFVDPRAFELAEFGPIQLGLAKRFGGDESVKDLPRVLRIPGSVHWKGPNPVRSKIVLWNGETPNYSREQFTEFLAAIGVKWSAPAPKVKTKDSSGKAKRGPQGVKLVALVRKLALDHAVETHNDPKKPRNGVAYRLGARIADKSLPRSAVAEAVEFFTEHARQEDTSGRHDPLDYERTLETALRGFDIGGEAPDDAVPRLLLEEGSRHVVADQALALAVEAGVPIYQRGGELLRPRDDVADGQTVLARVESAWLRRQFDDVASFTRLRKGVEARVSCPLGVVDDVMSNGGAWGTVPVIRSVVNAPTMRPDGSLLLEPGYDPATGLLLAYRGPELSIPANPTKSEARKALDALCEPLSGFPFSCEADKSVALSAFLSGIARPCLPTAPMHGFDATALGSGKTLLADCVGYLNTGRPCAVLSQGASEEEDEKRLGALLLRGAGVVCLDNLERPLSGDFLCSALTSTTVAVRMLGESRVVDVPSSALLLCTGNNIVVRGDLTRRVIVCRLEPQCERPDERPFDVNLREWLPRHRHRLLTAALTVLRGFHVAGRPQGKLQPFGSFEDWSRLVRAALVWLGEADPLETRQRIERDDPVKVALGSVLAAWWALSQTWPSDKSKTKTAQALAGEASLQRQSDFNLALLEVAADRRDPDKVDARRLGVWLRRFQGRVVDGLRIVRAGDDTHGKVALWSVEAASTEKS